VTARKYPDLKLQQHAIVTAVAARLPGSDPDRLGELIGALKLLPQHAQELRDYLQTHRDALTSGDARGPAGLRRLLEVLAAEYPGVQRMRCGRCKAQVRLPYRKDGASICGNCYRRTRFKVCVRSAS
jgi:recombinational DNA repair protein (RecF pathway)